MNTTRRRPTRLLLIGLVAVLLLWGLAAAWAAFSVRTGLEAARGAVASAQRQLRDADISAAEASIERAREQVDRATTSASNPAITVLHPLPLVGPSATVVTRIADAASASVDVLDAALAEADTLVTEDGRLAIPVRQSGDGALDLSALEQVQRAFDAIPVEALRTERDRLAGTPSSGLPGFVAEARSDALAQVDDALTTLDRATAAVEVLPGFLGADGPRSYFLAMQNPSELRGTGGLIGFYAVLTIDDGRFSMSDPTRYNALSTLDGDGNNQRNLSPVATTPEFADRYGHVNAAGSFANINVDPDLPTTAPVVLDYYADRRGRDLDGLIALDPSGLADIMQAVGAVELPREALEGAEPGMIQNPVRPKDIPATTMIDAYNAFGGGNLDRKEFLSTFAEVVFQQLFTSSWKALDVGRQAGAAAGDEHLQLYSVDPTEQSAFELLDVAGQLPRPAPITPGPDSGSDRAPSDVLGVSANNAAGNKQDVHVGHRIGVDISFANLESLRAQRRATVEVAVDNPVPTDGMDIYIVGAHPVGVTEKGKDFVWSSPRGLNRTWFTVWAPETDEFTAVRDADGEPITATNDAIHGHSAFDVFLETPSESTNSFQMDLDGPVRLRKDGKAVVYDIVLWHQSKAIPDHWDASVTAPSGWVIADASFSGGGSGEGMGVAGEKVPRQLDVSTDRTTATLTGTAMADLRLEVRFVRE